MSQPRPPEPESQPPSSAKPGTVTKVVPQVKRKDRVSVFIDGRFAFGVSRTVAESHGLRVDVRLDREILLRIDRDEEVEAAKRLAVNYISHRMRSESEVRRRLSKNGTSNEGIEDVVTYLKGLGYLDDAAFAGAFARDGTLNKKWGPHRIASGLRKAGVGDRHVSDAMTQARQSIEDGDLLTKLARKRWQQLERVSDVQRRKKRVFDYLARRGFDFDDVRRAIDELS